MQGLMLAAGMGKRLGKYTGGNTKCMVEVAGKKLIDRAIESLQKANINKLILVVGYKGQNLIDYIEDKYKNSNMQFVYIMNNDYDKSNNIYSFYMAKKYLCEDDTILLESDLIYDETLIEKIVKDQHKDLAVVAKYKSWMDGTVVRCNENGFIEKLIDKKDMKFDQIDEYYKTVNIYKFSKEFASQYYLPFLEVYMNTVGLNSYYETPLKVVCDLFKDCLFAYELGNLDWYEIDDAQDLSIANWIFSEYAEKFDSMNRGGFWKYPKLKNFSSLNNFYFPNNAFLEKIKYDLHNVLINKSSCSEMLTKNLERLFSVDNDLFNVYSSIKVFIDNLNKVLKNKKIAIARSVYESYGINKDTLNSDVLFFDDIENGNNVDNLKNIIDNVDCIIISRPNLLIGELIRKEEILDVIKFANDKNKLIVVDETLIDYCKDKVNLLDKEILEANNNLIVIKDIATTYGFLGLNLVVSVSYNDYITDNMRKILNNDNNIESMSDYFLQVLNLFVKDFNLSIDDICKERDFIINELSSFNNVTVYDSNSNSISIRFRESNAVDFCKKCLKDEMLFVKCFSSKESSKSDCIRFSIKDRHSNEKIILLIKEFLEL